MKIIKEGREQNGWSMEYHCTGNGNGQGGCGAILLVEEEDVFKTKQRVNGEQIIFYSFRCPSCCVVTDLLEGAFNANKA